MEHWWNDNDRVKPKYSEKKNPVPEPVFSITNTTWTGVELKPGLHAEKPATKRLSYGTADISVNLLLL
jgi:hypothetical protein